MTVIVTRMSGGIAQMFTPETGKITYKSKIGEAYMKLDAFDGIVKFNAKGAKAIVAGPKTTLENAIVIKSDSSLYPDALKIVLESKKRFIEEKISILNSEKSQIDSQI